MTAKTPRCHEFLKRQREEFRVAMETAQREHREQMGAMVRIMDALRAAIPGQAPLADEKAAHAKTRRQLADTEAELGALRSRLESA